MLLFSRTFIQTIICLENGASSNNVTFTKCFGDLCAKVRDMKVNLIHVLQKYDAEYYCQNQFNCTKFGNLQIQTWAMERIDKPEVCQIGLYVITVHYTHNIGHVRLLDVQILDTKFLYILNFKHTPLSKLVFILVSPQFRCRLHKQMKG